MRTVRVRKIEDCICQQEGGEGWGVRKQSGRESDWMLKYNKHNT
jgi:hypothetical protein